MVADEPYLVALLADLATQHWKRFQQPLPLGAAGMALAQANIRVRESKSGKLKAFVKRTQGEHYKLVDHPRIKALVGIIPADVEFDTRAWIGPNSALHLRAQLMFDLGLQEHEAGSPETASDKLHSAEKVERPEPVEDLPSVFGYSWSEDDTIVVDSSSANVPHFPFRTSEKDHKNRLEACRTLSNDLAHEIKRNRLNIREEYYTELTRYHLRLPESVGSGNILLADAAVRVLRHIFAAELNILSPSFAASLRTVIEQHIALRPYYPELEVFYRDVRSGRLDEPLPLDAVDDVLQAIQENTPQIFDPSVAFAIDESSVPPITVVPDEETPASPNQPTPPPDPLGDLDLSKSHDFQIAGVINKLWQVFLKGEAIQNALDAWSSTYASLTGPVGRILSWIQRFLGS